MCSICRGFLSLLVLSSDSMSHLWMFCVMQLRRMQDMIAKMQAQMQNQGEGDGQHV